MIRAGGGTFARRVPLLLMVAWLAAYPVVLSAGSPLVVPVAVASGAVVVVAGIRGRPTVAYTGVGGLFAAYLLGLVIGDAGVDLGAPVIGVVGYLTVECVELCESPAAATTVARQVTLHRALFVTAVTGAGAAVAVGALWAGAASRVVGPAAMGAGALTALAALWVLVGATYRAED